MVTNFKDIVKNIKDNISCVEVASKHGLPIHSAGDRCRSPFHEGKNPTSFVCFDNYWHSYSDPDKSYGDVIDLYAYLENVSKGVAISRLAASIGLSLGNDYSPSEWSKKAQILNDNIQAWNVALFDNETQLKYLHSRRINDDTIRSVCLGWDGQCIIIPCWKNGSVVYYAKRNASYRPGGSQSKYIKATITGFNENEIFGLQTLERNKDTLIIAEGAFDYLSFYQEGYAVISGIGGTWNKEHRRKLCDIARTYHTIYLTYDRDDNAYHTGQKFDDDVFSLLEPYCRDIRIVNIPETAVSPETGEIIRCKDVSDYYTVTGNLSDLLDNATDGYLWKARRLSHDLMALSGWMKPIALRIPQHKSNAMFSALREDGVIPADYLKYLEKMIHNAPEESTIVDELLKRHTLIHVPGYGFFEWKNGYWNAVHDNTIRGYAGLVLGKRWNTNARTNATLGNLQADPRVSKPDVQFNRTPCVNFRNGTLDIRKIDIWNGEKFNDVREPRQEDYLTYRLPYNYDPNARCSRWEHFVHEVTNATAEDVIRDETNDANVLQQYAGYILYTDNRLHKALVLEGEASNGKSIFTNVISRVFQGESNDDRLPNVTSVSVDSLAQRFNAISLANSMLNINTELRSNIAGAEDTFKMAIAGDMLRDSFKGKDSVQFRPRSKFIISLNEPIKSSDITEGFFRRLLIVEFPVHFTLNPRRPGDRLADINLESTLTTPDALSGIFNWAYRGYQMLWHNGYQFYISDNSRRMLRDMERSNDPILNWATDYTLTEPVTADELWQTYSEYCEDANVRRCSRDTFLRRIGILTSNGKLPWESARKSIKHPDGHVSKLRLYQPVSDSEPYIVDIPD